MYVYKFSSRFIFIIRNFYPFLIFLDRQLTGVIKDLFEAGSETSSTTLSWIFLYLSTFPEVQKKLQEEIDRVVGNSRHCGLSDRPK